MFANENLPLPLLCVGLLFVVFEFSCFCMTIHSLRPLPPPPATPQYLFLLHALSIPTHLYSSLLTTLIDILPSNAQVGTPSIAFDVLTLKHAHQIIHSPIISNTDYNKVLKYKWSRHDLFLATPRKEKDSRSFEGFNHFVIHIGRLCTLC